MDEQQTPVAGTPIYQESNQGKNAKWLWLLIIIIIIGGLVFAFIRGIGPFGQLRGGAEEASPTPTSDLSFVSSPSPEATSGANIDKSSAKIRILNGSGKAGAASSAKDFLEGLGYKVASVGNADKYDFEQTVLRFKASFSDFEAALTSDMSSKYSVTSGESLESTDSADIEVILGSK